MPEPELKPVYAAEDAPPTCPKCGRPLQSDYQQWTFIFECGKAAGGCGYFFTEQDDLAIQDMERLGQAQDAEW